MSAITSKKTVGRPPKYKSKEEIEEKIESYFKKCEGKILRDDGGNPVFDKYGRIVIVDKHPPTVTGLAIALGFSTRQSLLNYQEKKEFVDTITRAKTMVEAYAEERLFDRDGCAGAQFSLKNNFVGWSDKKQSDMDIEEQRARIEQVKAQTERMRTVPETGTEDGVEIINDAYEKTDKDIGYYNTEVSANI